MTAQRGPLGRSSLLSVSALVLAATCFAAGLYLAQAYPIAPAFALAAFTLWSVLAFFKPSVWLFGLPALLPIVGFASWTGWISFEEFDMLVLGTAAGAYARTSLRATLRAEASANPGARHVHFSQAALLLIFLFACSGAIALWRGITAAGGLQFGWFQNYDGPMNSIRLFKSFAFALLIVPLLKYEMRRIGGRAIDLLGAGLVAGLAGASAVVLWERAAFTGLLDFSQDYRVTGPFWEMHVGGAALDGYLALTAPFAIRELMRGSHRTRLFAAIAVAGIAGYACLVTFSRGVYLATPISLAVLALLVLRQRHMFSGWTALGRVSKGLMFAALLALGTFVVFRAGGYRTSLAALALLALALPLETVVRKISIPEQILALMSAGVLGTAGAIVATQAPKGAYLVFAGVFFLCAAFIWQARVAGGKKNAFVALTAYFWLAIAACVVASTWGGPGALRDCAIVMAFLVALMFWCGRASRPVWPENLRAQLATVGFATIIVGSVVVFSAGAYMTDRFSSSKGDLAGRVSHWREGLTMLNGPADWLLGEGLGRFPAKYFFDAPNSEFPGTFRLMTGGAGTFLMLTGPHYKYLGFGELFRISQRVRAAPGANYSVIFQARARQALTLQVEVCEKHLLYNAGCAFANVQVPAGDGSWRRFAATLDGRGVYGGPWYAPRLAFFSIAVANPSELVEIDNISLIGPGGANLIANGDFSQQTAHWFFTSDKSHLPWHIKNLALNVLFDQGAIGLALFAGLVGGALVRLTLGRACRHPDAPFIAASLIGFLVVGAFDSLLDVPRVAFLFYLLLLVSLLLKNPRGDWRGATGSAKNKAPTRR